MTEIQLLDRHFRSIALGREWRWVSPAVCLSEYSSLAISGLCSQDLRIDFLWSCCPLLRVEYITSIFALPDVRFVKDVPVEALYVRVRITNLGTTSRCILVATGTRRP